MEAQKQFSYLEYEVGNAGTPSHRPMYLKQVLSFLQGLDKGSLVLDAGCGNGDFSLGLKDAQFTVYGSDLSESGIHLARQLGIGCFEMGSLYDDLRNPFSVQQFDAIVAIEVIEHLYSPKTFAMRAYEALRPGGLFLVSTPYWGYLKNLLLALTNRTDQALTALWDGGHIKHFSRATLSELMAREGFEVVGFSGCGKGARGFPYVWSGMLMAFRKPLERSYLAKALQ